MHQSLALPATKAVVADAGHRLLGHGQMRRLPRLGGDDRLDGLLDPVNGQTQAAGHQGHRFAHADVAEATRGELLFELLR